MGASRRKAPDKRDLLGTLMPGPLAGHRRCAHITARRGDAMAAQALGMARVVSQDAPRAGTYRRGRQRGLDALERLIANIGAALQRVKAAAE